MSHNTASDPGRRPDFSPRMISDRSIYRRAVEAVVWGAPTVNFDRMLQAFLALGGQANQVVFWSNLLDSRNQTLTPNPNTIYFMPFIDMTQTGPVVVEIPPADTGQITGTITDAWQVALEDVGPAGADKGAGAKYLILPPGSGEPAPDGHIVLRSQTNMATGLFRADIASGSEADIARAVAYGKRIRLYPLSDSERPPETAFVDALGADFDGTIPYDFRFFQAVDRFIQREPWQDRDKAMIDVLKSIGIEKGKPFAPGEGMRNLLDDAALEARQVLDLGYEALFAPFYAGRQWALPLAHELTEGLSNGFSTPGVYPVDTRGVFFSFAFSSVKTLGTGQFYLVSLRDQTGKPLKGENHYRLTVPPDVPVRLYWSATVYDRSTHALLSGSEWSSRASTTSGLQTNVDGSVDLFFGPKPPAGGEGNWIPTQPGRDWEVMMRFYGPEKPLLEKRWALPDIEKLG